jgi:ADP-ribosylglycohydrolase
MPPRAEAVVGCLLGTAVGDALGLPYENLSPRRQRRLFPDLDVYHFLPGRGMVSDDTEHACMVAQVLIVSAGDEVRFLRSLGWRLRGWLLGLPAGIGKATARALVKLWLGFPPHKSGVFSAGNGPAMRAPILGVCFGDDPIRLAALVQASTRITHTDPRADDGALAIAWAAHRANRSDGPVQPQDFIRSLIEDGCGGVPRPSFMNWLDRLKDGADVPTETFAESMGLKRGVSGFIEHTVPVALQAWLRHQDNFHDAVTAAIRCGGDTDTVAAIVGGIVGARVGKAGIPAAWLDGLWEWPRSVAWMEQLGERLAEVCVNGRPQPALPLAWWAIPPRNLFFLAVVLAHGFRRLLPPY